MCDTGRVLVVDDEEHIRHCLEYALDSCGYEVVTCASAQQALDHCRKGPFDYVITDCNMEGMNGMELTKLLRAMHPRAVIIGMSGDECGEDFLLAGANDFRQKPFIPYEIAMMIDGSDLQGIEA